MANAGAACVSAGGSGCCEKLQTDIRRPQLLHRAALWAAHYVQYEADEDAILFYRKPDNQIRVMSELSVLGACTAASAFRAFFDASAALSLEQVLADLREDYARLFVGPGPGAAPPYESLYLGEGRYGGEVPRDFERALARAGLERTGSLGPADHLSIEIALLGHWSLSGNVSECRWLIQEHLLRWVFRWADDVQSNARTSFYRAVAALVVDVVACGRGTLDD